MYRPSASCWLAAVVVVVVVGGGGRVAFAFAKSKAYTHSVLVAKNLVPGWVRVLSKTIRAKLLPDMLRVSK